MKKLAAVVCALGVLFLAGCTSCCGPQPCCSTPCASPCCPTPCCK